MLRRGFAIVATAVVVGGALDSAAISATIARAGRLSDGFSVAEGSHLVGRLFPLITYKDRHGWMAYLRVRGDGAAVYDAYARQAHKLGLTGVAPSEGACRAAGAGVEAGRARRPINQDLVCEGVQADRRDLYFELDVRVCTACAPPISAGLIFFIARNGVGLPTRRHTRPTAAPTVGHHPPSVQLTAEQARRARDEVPTTGETLASPSFFSINAFRVISGTRVLAASSLDTCTIQDTTAILRVTGNPTQVFAAYRRQMPSATLSVTHYKAARTVGSMRVRQARDEFSTITLTTDDHASHPLMMVYECQGA